MEHLSPHIIERFRQRRVSVDELKAVGSHLKTCTACQARLVEATSSQQTVDNFFSTIASARDNKETSLLLGIKTWLNEANPFFSTLRLDYLIVPIVMLTLVVCLSLAIVMYRYSYRNSSPQAITSNAEAPKLSPVNQQANLSVNSGTLTDVGVKNFNVQNLRNTNDSQFSERHQTPKATNDEAASRIAQLQLRRPDVLDDVIMPAVTTLKGPAEDADFAVISPVATVVADERPAFRWQAVPKAASYRVELTELSTRKLIVGEPVARPEWTPNESLARGSVYLWNVVAVVDGDEISAPRPPAPEARFKILEADRAAKLNRSLRSQTHLTRGALYANEGLMTDAEREFNLELKANPQSKVARSFLKRLRSWRRVKSNS